MGCASRGGGAVESGPANKMMSETSKSTGVPMMAKGGMANKGGINEHKRMAMGKPILPTPKNTSFMQRPSK